MPDWYVWKDGEWVEVEAENPPRLHYNQRHADTGIDVGWWIVAVCAGLDIWALLALAHGFFGWWR